MDSVHGDRPYMQQGWKTVGTTYKTEWFKVAADIFVAVPETDYHDSPEAARANLEMMRSLAREAGRNCGFVVLMSHHVAQDAEARGVYAQITSSDMVCGTALVANSPLSLAISSFFLGLSRPAVPTKVVSTIEEGIAWLESLPRT